MTTTERKPHVHADVIRAYADGHEIEWSLCPDGSWWQAIEIPTFFSAYFYRVKPEPPPEPKTWYQVVVKSVSNGRLYIFDGLYTSEDHFREMHTENAYTILKLIPVYTEE